MFFGILYLISVFNSNTYAESGINKYVADECLFMSIGELSAWDCDLHCKINVGAPYRYTHFNCSLAE